MNSPYEEKRKKRHAAADELFYFLREKLPEIKELKEDIQGHWGLEDVYYRYLHQSFKVYYSQRYILQFKKIIEDVAKKNECYNLNKDIEKIFNEALVGEFDHEHNKDWEKYTRPQVEALMHVSSLLNFMVHYLETLEEPPQILPSGWAAVLYLFGVR